MKKKGGQNLLVITQVPQVSFWGSRVLQTFDGKFLRTYYCKDKHSRFPRFTSVDYATKFLQSELVDCRRAHIGDVFHMHIHNNGAPGIKLWKISTHRGRRIAWHLGFKSDETWADSYEEAEKFLDNLDHPELVRAIKTKDKYILILNGLDYSPMKVWISPNISKEYLSFLLDCYGQYWSSDYPRNFYLSI